MTRPVLGWLILAIAVAVIAALLLLSVSAPRAAVDPTSTASRGLSGTSAAASGRRPLPGAPQAEGTGFVLSGQADSGRAVSGASSPPEGRSYIEAQAGGAAVSVAEVASGAAVGTVIEAGGLNQAARSHGDRYLAIRAPRGTLVRVCGPAACRVMVSTDYGPQHGTGKIADVALVVWDQVCGVPRSRGWCPGSIEYPLRVPRVPATDTAP